ncbi:MAG TPA: hypothetical protein VLS25_08045 [Dehalococcoidia bacterium]|nr:hypothetical protein [Dehalococcoidia bacterium]
MHRQIPRVRPQIRGRLRPWNVIAVYPSVVESRRACAAIRGARLRSAAISAGQTMTATGFVRMGGYASERTSQGVLLGGLAGLFAGGILAGILDASTPLEVIATLVFCMAGGGATGGMMAGASEPAGQEAIDGAIDRLWPDAPVYLAVHCNSGDDAVLAASVMAGLQPADLYCLSAQGQVVW